MTSQGEDAVYAVSPDGAVLGKFTGGGILGPWGTSIDGDDNVWVANFGPLQAGTNFVTGRLSKLVGADPLLRVRPALAWDNHCHQSPATRFRRLAARCCCTMAIRCTVWVLPELCPHHAANQLPGGRSRERVDPEQLEAQLRRGCAKESRW